jgi:hypothetical protein
MTTLINFFKKKQEVHAPKYDIDVWWDDDIKLWVATYKDEYNNQRGDAGYGATKHAAELDVAYQNYDTEI